jgi:hypothetical protein
MKLTQQNVKNLQPLFGTLGLECADGNGGGDDNGNGNGGGDGNFASGMHLLHDVVFGISTKFSRSLVVVAFIKFILSSMQNCLQLASDIALRYFVLSS